MSKPINFKTESSDGQPWPSMLDDNLESGWDCFSIVRTSNGMWVSYFKKIEPNTKIKEHTL